MLSNPFKIMLFANELKLIKDTNIRNAIKFQLTKVPDYFFYVPASSSGKYHPEYTLGEGGLLRHVKAAVAIASELFVLEDYSFSDIEQDEIIAALILHDSFKAGEDAEEYDTSKPYQTVTEHPVIAANSFISNISSDDAVKNLIDTDTVLTIANLILTHMGQWNKKYHSDETFAPKPETKAQKFVHLCDFLASRKRLEVNTDY